MNLLLVLGLSTTSISAVEDTSIVEDPTVTTQDTSITEEDPDPEVLNGFITNEKGETSYYIDNVPVVGFYDIDNYTYYFNSKGIMCTSWQDIDGYKYYFLKDGKMMKGFKTLSKKIYYFSSKGRMRTKKGFFTVKNKTYYLNTSHTLDIGFKIISKKIYYFDNKGIMATGWKTLSKKKYYFFKDGHAATGLQTISNKKYYFSPKGVKLSYAQYKMDHKVKKLASKTKYIILVDCKAHRVGVYKGKKKHWKRIKYWKCGDGKTSSPTIKGTYTTGPSIGRPYKRKYFDSFGSRCWYATRIHGPYLFHSVLYKIGPTPNTLNDGRVGKGVSHGCVRLEISNAKWIYDHIGKNTKVVIYQ